MFRDARGIQNGSSVETDLCIIGGGAAGITLALGAKEAGFSTLVVEAGGFDFDDETQAVYSGTVVSDVLPPAYLWTSRLRQFGGTTNHWGGHSVVINANIFESRAGVPGGQWPFGSDELRPYYVRAAEILKKREGVREQWRPQAEAGLVPMERYAGSTVAENRLGPAYRQELEEARLQVLLHGSVTGLNFAPSPTRVGSVTVQTLAGNFFSLPVASLSWPPAPSRTPGSCSSRPPRTREASATVPITLDDTSPITCSGGIGSSKLPHSWTVETGHSSRSPPSFRRSTRSPRSASFAGRTGACRRVPPPRCRQSQVSWSRVHTSPRKR